MLIFHNPSQREHVGRQEMFRGRLVPSVETPARVEHVLQAIERRPLGELRTPTPLDLSVVRQIHAPHYLAFLESAWRDWIALDAANVDFDVLPSVWPNQGLRRDALPTDFSARVGQFAFDAGSPISRGTWQAAADGAACAIDAAKAVAAGDRASMALTRPPGHHAGADFYGGYCFLNNAALAAQTLRGAGAARVAIVDVDYHHGNGTQSIFYERGDVFTASIHGNPTTEYPFYLGYAEETGSGAGQGCNLNLPLARGTNFSTWSAALERALDQVQRFGADALVIPLGVDTYEHDPISRFTVRSEEFIAMGRMLAAPKLPTVFTLEGGYAVSDLGVNVLNVLEGFLS